VRRDLLTRLPVGAAAAAGDRSGELRADPVPIGYNDCMRDRRRLVGALFVVAATIAVAPGTGATSSLDDCAQRVIREWSSRGDVGTHSLACYRAALQALPEDVRQYSDAEQVLEEAMAVARETRTTESVTRVAAPRPRAAPQVAVVGSTSSVPYPIVALGSLALVLLAAAAVARRR
jgi:hypothetical protein